MPRRAVVAFATIVGAALVLGGCKEGKGEDRPNVDVIDGGGAASASNSGAVEGYGDPLYFPASNQDLNLAIGLDLQDMRSILSAAARGDTVDWAAATTLYTRGKNQKQADGSLRSLASLAAREYPAAFPGEPPFIDAIIRGGLEGTGRGAGLSDNARRQLVDKGIQVLMYGRAMQALADADARFAGDARAAGASIDEAWATLSGARDASTGSPNNGLLATALGREEDFRLQGRLARPLESTLLTALAASERKDAAAFTKAVGTARSYLDTILYLSTLRYAKVLEADQRESDRQFHLAEAWAFFQAIRPRVAAASATQAQTVEAVYSRPAIAEFPATATAQVYTALNDQAVLRALAIPAEFQFKAPPQ